MAPAGLPTTDGETEILELCVSRVLASGLLDIGFPATSSAALNAIASGCSFPLKATNASPEFGGMLKERDSSRTAKLLMPDVDDCCCAISLVLCEEVDATIRSAFAD